MIPLYHIAWQGQTWYRNQNKIRENYIKVTDKDKNQKLKRSTLNRPKCALLLPRRLYWQDCCWLWPAANWPMQLIARTHLTYAAVVRLSSLVAFHDILYLTVVCFAQRYWVHWFKLLHRGIRVQEAKRLLPPMRTRYSSVHDCATDAKY